MHRWRIFVSYFCGMLALLCAHLAELVGQKIAVSGAFCWIVAVWLILICMAFAQDDGIYNERRRKP